MMSLFFRELKAYRNSLFFWCIGMVALVAASMTKYGAFHGSGQSFNNLIAEFPKSVQIIFGISGFDLTRADGFYGLIFMYVALMATVHAVLLGTDIVSKEERDKTSEFLFVKPISRAKALTAKLCAGLIELIILNIVTLVSSFYAVGYFTKNNSANHEIELLMSGLFFLQLLYFFAGVAIAAGVKKPKGAASIATAVLLVTFILPFFINFNYKLDRLKYLTPYKYFDARTMMTAGQLDSFYVGLSLLLIVAMTVSAYLTFSNRDLNI